MSEDGRGLWGARGPKTILRYWIVHKHMSNLKRFQEVIAKTTKPVFVEFGAQWCNPCRNFAPIFKSIGETHKDKATFIMVDIDEGGDIAAAYNVSSIPHLKVFIGGKVVEDLNAPKERSLMGLLKKYA
jgi:thioredoxin 1